MTTTNALETRQLGKRYGRKWALQNCDISIPAGGIAALVGPNGAGKSTLLNICTGLLSANMGEARIFGELVSDKTLPRVGFVAQDHPLYKDFSLRDLLKLGSKLNKTWDQQLAERRFQKLDLPLERKAGKFSGGQQAQIALVMALAKRPDILLLDEPLASLDPLARREFLGTLMDAVMETGMTVLLSSHNISDLERVCDHLIILNRSRVSLDMPIADAIQTHKRLTGPRRDHAAIESLHAIIEASDTERQTSLFVRTNGVIFDPSWQVQAVSLEDIVLAYLAQKEESRLASVDAHESSIAHRVTNNA